MSESGYPRRLHHKTPAWVPRGAVFHIRIRCDAGSPKLTDSSRGTALLESVEFYVEQRKWSCFLCLLMPDHLHMLLSFSREEAMSRIISDWKRHHAGRLGILWQDNFFDHRIRSQGEFEEKFQYILRNPLVKGLSETPEEWPWQITSTDVLPQF